MIEIKKAKLNPDKTLIVEYEEVVAQPGSNEEPFRRNLTSQSNLQVHIDLEAAMEQLLPHFVIILELVPEEEAWDPDPEEMNEILRKLVQTYEVRGVTLKGGDNPRCLITGVKKLSTGENVAINTPLTPLDPDKYKFGVELEKCLKTLVREIKAYVFEQKHAEDLQTHMDLK